MTGKTEYWKTLVYLDTVGDEAEDCSEPEEKGKTSEKILTKFDPFWNENKINIIIQQLF